MEFNNKVRDRGAKDDEGCFESVEVDGIILSVGDLVVWSDPDAGMHAEECELIHSEEWVVKVTEIYKSWDSYNEEWELKIGNSGVGWISWGDIAIPGEKGNWVLDDFDAERLVDDFEESEYEDYMVHQYHMGRDGTPERLWYHYKDKDYGNSGPHCEYCMSDDGLNIFGN